MPTNSLAEIAASGVSHGSINPDKASDTPATPYMVNDVSWPLAIERPQGIFSLWFRCEYCRLHDRVIIRELTYTFNDKSIILRYKLTRYIE